MTALRDDHCIICETPARVNAKGQCHKCWLAYSGWTPPADLLSAPLGDTRERDENDEYKPVIVSVTARADGGALFDNYLANVNSDSWRVDKGWKADDVGPFGVYHQPASPPVGVSGQQKPWQRYSWQVEGKKTRTSPHRITNGVSVPCLICLDVGIKLRRDQVCEACEQNWRTSGRPWGDNYDKWIATRRADKSTNKVTGVPFADSGTARRDDTKSTNRNCYNGAPGDTNNEPATSSKSSSESDMVKITFEGEPTQVIAAIKQIGSPEVPRVAEKANKRELGEIVALRRPS